MPATKDHGVLQLTKGEWSGSTVTNSHLTDLSPSSPGSFMPSAVTVTSFSSYESRDEVLSEKLAGLAKLNKGKCLRPVHKISPLQSITLQPAFGAAANPPVMKPLPLTGLQASKPLAAALPLKEPGPTNPVAIPGASQDSLDRQTSLIKAVPAPMPKPRGISRHEPVHSAAISAMAPPTGSWTQRQIRYPLEQADHVKQLPVPPNMSGRTRTRKSAAMRMADLNPSGAAKDMAAHDDAAWRFRFKKKWIREELFARKRDFPDEPGYEDPWADALGLIEACGPGAALQAAFLEHPGKGNDGSSADLMEGTEGIFFEEFYDAYEEPTMTKDMISATSDVSAKAATLVRLQRRVGVF